MVDPQVVIKANHNRTLLTIRVSAINSPDWTEIVGTRIELFRDANYSNATRFVNNTTTHYKVRAYLENEIPDQTVYGRVTLTKNDNTTHTYTFNFVVPHPVLGTVVDEDGTRYIASFRKMSKSGVLSPRNYTNKAIIDAVPYIDIMADTAGEMLVGNQWSTPILVENITQGTAQVSVNASSQTTIAVAVGDIVRVKEGTTGTTFRTFTNYQQPLCMGVSAHITRMPAMDKFTLDVQGTAVNDYFFYYFNRNGTLTSLPEGSFDIRKITQTGGGTSYTYRKGFFQGFNYSGALTSLPEGSFDTSNIINGQTSSIFDGAFSYFNAYGALTSLPEGSFDFDSMKYAPHMTPFQGFNQNGALTTLPEGSFGFTSLLSTVNAANAMMFSYFNQNGLLATLPAGAFHFKEGISYPCSFSYFNKNGSLTSLPEHSFNFSIQRGTFTFRSFNENGALTSLPAGSFKLASNWTFSDSSAFSYFNKNGALTSLPVGSFNTDNFITLGQLAFSAFNQDGALTSLPENSFNFDNVTTVQEHCFSYFNYRGALKTLPKGSFSLKNLTTINGSPTGEYFLYQFNYGGMLEYLPVGAFSISSVTTMTSSETFNFNDFNNPYNGVGGLLRKSETDYNPDFVFITTNAQSTKGASYYDEATDTHFSETIVKDAPFKYWEADYFSVSYTPSAAYTTNIAAEYLSGQAVTFTATAADPEYLVTPTITTGGGNTITVTDNGDDTFTFTMPKDNITVTFAVSLRPAVITLVAEETGTMKIINKWNSPVIVDNLTQGTSATIQALNFTNIAVNLDDEITITEGLAGQTFGNWGFNGNQNTGLATGTLCRIKEMPPVTRFTSPVNGTYLSTYSFYRFCQADNNNKGITSLPAGSFDTSMISNCGGDVFGYFNQNGLLTSLPAGSFKFTNLTQVADWFCEYFNCQGGLTSLPAGSFNIENLAKMYNSGHFRGFNREGALTSLPAGSFKFDSLEWVTDGDFSYFNYDGALTSLPAGSFNTGDIALVYGDNVFAHFNCNGALTSLPAGSFDFGNLTNLENRHSFCYAFNAGGALTSLPAGSFNIDNITKVGNHFFAYFNQNGDLTSLPAGSFNTSNITSVGTSFFDGFNYKGGITALPAGSFDTTNITSAGASFLLFFNAIGGHLTKTTVVGEYNPNMINASSQDVPVNYYGGTAENVSPGSPFYFKTA